MLTSLLNIYAALSITTAGEQTPGNGLLQTNNTITIEDTLPASMIPVKKSSTVEPLINAEGVIIVDFESGELLYEKNVNKKLQIASITKLMTAIIALEEGDLNSVVHISNNAVTTEGSKVWLYSGENITLSNLLRAVLIQSGNDAAVAVAEHIAGDVPKFVDKMNAKAKELKLYNTHYSNPIGFDSLENYSTVKDLAQLARYAFRKSFIRETVRMQAATVSSVNGEQSHDLKTTNELLSSFLNVLGLKTGSTEGAGLCFVSIIENNKGNKIITVVLNSPDRFGETKILASWAFRSYIW